MDFGRFIFSVRVCLSTILLRSMYQAGPAEDEAILLARTKDEKMDGDYTPGVGARSVSSETLPLQYPYLQ